MIPIQHLVKRKRKRNKNQQSQNLNVLPKMSNLIYSPRRRRKTMCGVFDSEKGTMCARSLTCKSHSMSAKRAVLGRSQPYDTLLSQWQRKNQAKATTTQKAVVQQEAEDVDSEEEVRLVMQGVMKRYARPMEQRCIVGVRRKIRGMRMYEGLKGALLGAVQNMSGSGVGRGRRQSQAADA